MYTLYRPNFSVILFFENEIDPCGFAYPIQKIFSNMTSYTEWGYVFHRTLQNVENVLGEVARTCSNWSKAYFTPFHAIAVNREQKIISTHVHTSVTCSEFTRLHTTGKIKFYKNPWGCAYSTCKADESEDGGTLFPRLHATGYIEIYIYIKPIRFHVRNQRHNTTRPKMPLGLARRQRRLKLPSR